MSDARRRSKPVLAMRLVVVLALGAVFAFSTAIVLSEALGWPESSMVMGVLLVTTTLVLRWRRPVMHDPLLTTAVAMALAASTGLLAATVFFWVLPQG